MLLLFLFMLMMMNKFTLFALYLLRHKRLNTLIVLTAATSACLLLLDSNSLATLPAQKPEAALTITAAAAKQAQWATLLEANGAITPWQEAIIGAQVSGLRLTRLNVNVGDQVKRGQILAEFDADLLRADEARLNASWQEAESNRQRALQLKGTGGISEQEIVHYVTQANVAKAQLKSSQLQLRYIQVTAPDEGVISARNATLGAVSGSGQELFRMIRQNRLEWRGELTAPQIAQIKPKQQIDLTLPDGSQARAIVRKIAPSLDSQTRLGLVYADIQPNSTARAGMYATGSITLGQSPAIAIPAMSVIIRDGRSYTPKLIGSNRIALHAVTAGRRQGDMVEIVSGIQAGDQVAVQGAGFLNDGDSVRVSTTVKE